MNYYSDESEWKWLFNNAVDWDSIISLYYPEFPTEDGFENKEDVKKFLEELVDSTGEWCGTSVKEIGELLKDQDERKLQNDNLDKEILDLEDAHRVEISDINNKNEKELGTLRGQITDKEHELNGL